MYSNLILGGAQLGLNYGIVGNKNYVEIENSKDILACAKDFGIRSVDIAYDYGRIFSWINDINPGLDVISKIKVFDNENLVHVLKSHQDIKRLVCLLIHDADLFISKEGEKKQVYQVLNFCRKNEIKWGISIYEANTLRHFIAKGLVPDLVQYPHNVLCYKDEIRNICFDHNIQTQIRSVLLQGLLALPSIADLPAQFTENTTLKYWYRWLKENNLHPIDTCLRGEHILNRVKVLGAQNRIQLTDLIKRSQGERIKCTSLELSKDEALLDPRNWKTSC